MHCKLNYSRTMALSHGITFSYDIISVCSLSNYVTYSVIITQHYFKSFCNYLILLPIENLQDHNFFLDYMIFVIFSMQPQ